MAKDTPPLQLINLSKRYGHARGIEEVNLTLTMGEVFGFLGPNGSGKTTTVRTIMNFLRPSQGEAKVFGLDSVRDSVAVKQRVGYLAGDLELYDNLTGAQYLAFMANLRGITNHKPIHELVERLGTTTGQKIRTLSRGNKQKIGLVAALMHDPDLLILDEPTSGLDPLMQNQFYEIVKEHTKRGKTVFISSHILSEVQAICDRVGFMRAGQLIETVDIAHLLQQAKKEVSLSYKSGAMQPKLTLPGLEILHQGKLSCRFLTTASAPEIVAWLAKQPVKDVTIQNASLDDMFLKLYGGVHQTEASHV